MTELKAWYLLGWDENNAPKIELIIPREKGATSKRKYTRLKGLTQDALVAAIFLKHPELQI